jgi:hypothetical protein
LLLDKAKMICDIGDTYEEPEPEFLDPSDNNLGIVEEEEYDATSTEGNGNEDSDSSDNPPGEEGSPNEEEEESGPAKYKVHRKRRFRVFQRTVKYKSRVEPKKVPSVMFQQMLSDKYEHTVTIKDKDETVLVFPCLCPDFPQSRSLDYHSLG